MSNKANAIIIGAVGVLMILGGFRMMGHDSGDAWYIIADLIMCFAGFADIAIGYKLFMED